MEKVFQDRAAAAQAMLRARSQSPGLSQSGRLSRERSGEGLRRPVEMSPAHVRDRVLTPRRYSAPVSKLGDARSCMSQPRNVEKMFDYFSDHPEDEQQSMSLRRQNSRENLYRKKLKSACPLLISI